MPESARFLLRTHKRGTTVEPITVFTLALSEFCLTTTYDCLPIETLDLSGPREGVSWRGDGQCGFQCVTFDIRMRDCYESHGSYDSQKDYCFGSDGGNRCWSHQDCKPEGPWGGLSGIGNNECGPPCQQFQNNPIFTDGCCTLGVGPLTATLDVFNKQDCEAERETTVLLHGQWNAACDCRTKDGKWTGWKNECGYHQYSGQ